MVNRTTTIPVRLTVEEAQRAQRDIERFGERGSRALQRLERSAQKPTKALVALDRASSGTGTAVAALGRQMAIIEGPLGGVSGRFSALSSSVRSFGLAATGLVAGIAATGFAMVKATAAANEYEKAMFTVEAVLRTTGRASGFTAGEIDKLAISIGQATLASTAEVRQAGAQLLTFRSIAGESFERTLRLAQDLAAVGMGSLTSSTQQLAKALEDPTRGLSQLRRVGVSFTATQEEIIKNMVETGRQAEAQAMILDVLEQQVGGAGVAQASGLAGAYDSLTENVNRFLEAVGRTDGLRRFIAATSEAVDDIREIFVPTDAERYKRVLREIDQAQRALFGFGNEARYEELEAIKLRLTLERSQSEEAKRRSAIIQEQAAAEAMAAKQAEEAEKARQKEAKETAKVSRQVAKLQDQAVTAGLEGIEALEARRDQELKHWRDLAKDKKVDAVQLAKAELAIDERYRKEIERSRERDFQKNARQRVRDMEELAKAQRKAYGRTLEGGLRSASDRYFDDITDKGQQAGRVLTRSFGEVEDALTNFFMGAGISFTSFFDSIKTGLARLAAQDVIASIGGFLGIGGGGSGGLLSGIVSGVGGFIGNVFGFSDGGMVRGRGTDKSDSNLAMLSNNEFVVNAAATRRHRPLLEAINQDGRVRGYALGGLVGDPVGGAARDVINEIAEGRDGGNVERAVARAVAAQRQRQSQAEARLVEQLLYGLPPRGGPSGGLPGGQGPIIERVRDMSIMRRIARFAGVGRPGGFLGSGAAGAGLSVLGRLVSGLFTGGLGFLASALLSVGGNLGRSYLTGRRAEMSGLGGMIYEHFAGGRTISEQVSQNMQTLGTRLASAQLVGPMEGRDGNAFLRAAVASTPASRVGTYQTAGQGALSRLQGSLAGGWASVVATGNRVMTYGDGGRAPAGRDIVVGERGPEVLRLDQPGTISPINQGRAMVDGGGDAALAAALGQVAAALADTNRLLRSLGMGMTSNAYNRRTAFA